MQLGTIYLTETKGTYVISPGIVHDGQAGNLLHHHGKLSISVSQEA